VICYFPIVAIAESVIVVVCSYIFPGLANGVQLASDLLSQLGVLKIGLEALSAWLKLLLGPQNPNLSTPTSFLPASVACT
jgi:hypothetical protein